MNENDANEKRDTLTQKMGVMAFFSKKLNQNPEAAINEWWPKKSRRRSNSKEVARYSVVSG